MVIEHLSDGSEHTLEVFLQVTVVYEGTVDSTVTSQQEGGQFNSGAWSGFLPLPKDMQVR